MGNKKGGCLGNLALMNWRGPVSDILKVLRVSYCKYPIHVLEKF